MMTNQEKIDSNSGKSIQNYIDEIPTWSDGTATFYVPMTKIQWRIWLLATSGKFFEGMVVFMMGLTLPLITIQFHLSSLQKGLISSSILFGILIGASALGGLADIYGRKRMFIIEMFIFSLCLIGLALSPSVYWIIFFNFGVGLALGCDYPTAHLMISENIPTNNRGKLVLGAFAFQSIGVFLGILVGIVVLSYSDDINAWRIMYAVAILPAIIITVARCYIPESAHWLLNQNKEKEAAHALRTLLKRTPQYPINIKIDRTIEKPDIGWLKGYKKLFNKKYRPKTLLASLPWFIQDLGTYGIGIFTPVILATMLTKNTVADDSLHGTISQIIYSAKGTALIDALLIVGVIFAIIYSDKIGRMKLQIYGFIGCAVGLLLAVISTYSSDSAHIYLLFAGFMLFNFMNNFGPNSQTYLISGEVFPVSIRAKGAGFSASIGKLGAITTAFLFPILMNTFGVSPVLIALIFTSLLGAWVTYHYRFETSGQNIENI
ncbi:MFS transporter [Shewanella marina]|uniref:MFS transporter n=1 Tax=Shewanella marina TaxID=487319 RepID=UPI000B0B1B42|nr:MFS transporter [Shewanella marina]